MKILIDDDTFGGSNEECRFFKETFLSHKTCGTVANNKPQSGKCYNTNAPTSCEHASLLTVKEVILKDSSNAHGSSKSKDSEHMKSSVTQGVNGNTHSENDLNSLMVQIESASTVLHPCADSSSPQGTFQVLEFSLFCGPSSSNISTAAAEPCINTSGDNDCQPNLVLNLEDNVCKDSEDVKQVTSPTSLESTGSKDVLTNDGSNSKSLEKESQEDDELFDDVSLNDARDQLIDAVTRLMVAKGWHIEIVQRTCRDYKEKVYISDSGKRVREFPKLWRLLGRSLSVNDYYGIAENTYQGWTDLDHYCKDVSLTLARTNLMINLTGKDSELAHIWNILDPFVNLMFIKRKLGALRRGKAIQPFRSIPVSAFVKNNGQLTFDKLNSVPKKKAKNKRKIQPSDSSLATNDSNQNAKASSRRISSFGEILREGSNPKMSKKAKSERMVTSHLGDKGKLKNVGQRGDDVEASIFEKVTGMEGSLFRSSLYDVHADSIKEWGSQNGVAEGTETVNGISNDHLKNHIAVETVVSHYVDSKVALLDFSGHEILQPSETFLGEKDFYHSSNVSLSEDPSARFKMLNGSMKEPEKNITSLHDVAVIWNTQTDLTCGKVTGAEIDIVTVGLDSHYTGAFNDGRSFGPSKQIDGLMADDDMLLSTIKKKTKKRGRPPKDGSAPNLKIRSVKEKAKGRGRGRKLQPRSGGKCGNQVESENCIISGTRTPLSWLIDNGVVHLDDTILYLKPQSKDVVKKGFLTKDGIVCYCCHEVYSVSKFRLHAGAKSPEACTNLFMDCGKPYSLCQLMGWSPEYLKRKNHKKPNRVEDEDGSDDICGLCGDGGDLVCCDNCPATYHQKCLSVQKVPEGDWYCFSCVCHICGEFSRIGSTKRLKCAQCEHKYHSACLMEKNVIPVVTDNWFCSELCRRVHSEIRSHAGVVVPLADGYSATLLRCLHDDDDDDEKAYSETPDTIRADCNTKLAVALTIMEECFLSMVDFRTGIDMIPHMLYNFGSNFPRLDFHGFYTVILEKDDVVMCVATIRIHGSSIAEIPLVATSSKYRRQGMCRLLMSAIEEMLQAIKINKIVLSAVPELVPTWINGFGFQPIGEEEKSNLRPLNVVVFPGTVTLQKSVLQAEPVEQTTQPQISADTIPVPKPSPVMNALQLSEWHPMSSEPDTINPGSNVVK